MPLICSMSSSGFSSSSEYKPSPCRDVYSPNLSDLVLLGPSPLFMPLQPQKPGCPSNMPVKLSLAVLSAWSTLPSDRFTLCPSLQVVKQISPSQLHYVKFQPISPVLPIPLPKFIFLLRNPGSKKEK